MTLTSAVARSRPIRVAFVAPALWLSVVLVGTMTAHTTSEVQGAGASQDVARAGVVVAFGGGTVREACVALPADGASGIDLLRLAGFDAVAEVTALGSKVCAIDGSGCGYPDESCWCDCRSLGDACTYWIYHQAVDGGWRYSTIGASDRRVQAGEVDGWAWGAGGEGYGAEPPLRTFDDVCGVAGEPPPGDPTQPATVEPATSARPPVKPAPPEPTPPGNGGDENGSGPEPGEPGSAPGAGEVGPATSTVPGTPPAPMTGSIAPAPFAGPGTVGGIPTFSIPAPSTLSAIGTALAGGSVREAGRGSDRPTITPATIVLVDASGARGSPGDAVAAAAEGSSASLAAGRASYMLGAVLVALVLAAGAAVGRRGRDAARHDPGVGRR